MGAWAGEERTLPVHRVPCESSPSLPRGCSAGPVDESFISGRAFCTDGNTHNHMNFAQCSVDWAFMHWYKIRLNSLSWNWNWKSNITDSFEHVTTLNSRENTQIWNQNLVQHLTLNCSKYQIPYVEFISSLKLFYTSLGLQMNLFLHLPNVSVILVWHLLGYDSHQTRKLTEVLDFWPFLGWGTNSVFSPQVIQPQADGDELSLFFLL